MKKTLFIPFLVVLASIAISCGKSGDKAADLASLKKQRDALNIQIEKLEKETGQTKTLVVKPQIVNVEELTTAPFNHYIEIPGRVDGEDNTSVFPANNALVTAVYVKQGDHVKRGQTLAQLDNSILLKNIDAAKVNVDLANTMYEKTKALWDQKIGTEVQFIQATANKEAAEKQLLALREQLDLYVVKSPISGSVEESNAKVGMFASPQNPMPLFRVVNFASVKVLADVSESYAAKIKPGNPVKVFFPDFNTELSSNLRFTSKYINPVNRTFTTEVRLGPSKVEYRANMMATVRINDYSKAAALTVPLSLIRDLQNAKVVFVARQTDNKWIARKVEVTVGNTYNGLAEINSGLAKGDLIITAGYNNLSDGQLIEINK